jgi:proteasome lid subunit RPN8/RPN11
MSGTDELQIFLGEAKVKTAAVGERQPPSAGLSTMAVECGDPSAAYPPVYIHEQALRGIEDHARSSNTKEVGGILLGGVYYWQNHLYVQIDDFLVARDAGEHRASLTFTHDTWAKLNAERETAKPKLSIVGWYHTHPNLGVFLSDKDQFIQQNFFRDGHQVALVLDPVCSERAFFIWSGGKTVKMPGFYVFGDCSRSREISELVESMRPRPKQSAPASVQASVIQPKVKVVFTEPSINLYYVMPRFLRKLFSIMNSQTAPRIGIKTLIIVALLGMVAYQFVAGRRQPPAAQGNDPSVHMRFARAFYEAKDYEESVREWRRYLASRPQDTDARGELLNALVQKAKTMQGYDWSEVDEEANRMRQQANQSANHGDYLCAYKLYRVLNANYHKKSDYKDLCFAKVLGYIVNGGEKPGDNLIAMVRQQIPGIIDAVQKRSDQDIKSSRRLQSAEEDKQ